MDLLAHGISADLSLRVVTAVTTDLVREACRRQGVTGLRAIALGRATTAGCLLSTLAKDARERFRIQIDGGGPIGRIIVDSRSSGEVRSCFERASEPVGSESGAELEDVDGRPCIGSAVGRGGLIVVTRDLGLENQYQGSVEMSSGEIDEDLEAYLDRSEQLPSALTCAVLLDTRGDVLRAGGVLCQTFPGGDPTRVEAVRQNLGGGTLRTVLHQERSAAELGPYALGGEAVDPMGTRELVYRCPCGEATAMRVLATLGADDLEALAAEQEQTEVRCHFCGQAYVVAAQQVRELALSLRRGLS